MPLSVGGTVKIERTDMYVVFQLIWECSGSVGIALCYRFSGIEWMLIRFHLEHHWGGGLASLGFGPDRIRNLVSMATDSSHRIIMGKTL